MENSISSVEPSPNPEPAGKSAAVIQVPRYSYYALTVLTLVNFLNYIDRQVLPAVAPAMRKELGLSQPRSDFWKMRCCCSYVVLALVFGRLGDRYSRTKLMAAAAAIWSLATGLTALTDKSPWLPSALQFRVPVLHFTIALSGVALALCAVRALVGVGESSYSTITPTLIADYFPLQRLRLRSAVFKRRYRWACAGYALGGALAYFFGWRMAFMVCRIAGLDYRGDRLRLKEPERAKSDRESGQTPIAHVEAAASHSSKRVLVANVLANSSHAHWLLSTGGYTALSFVLGALPPGPARSAGRKNT